MRRYTTDLGDTGDPIDLSELLGDSPGCMFPNLVYQCDTSSPYYGCYQTYGGECPEAQGAYGEQDWCCPDGYGPDHVPASEPDVPQLPDVPPLPIPQIPQLPGATPATGPEPQPAGPSTATVVGVGVAALLLGGLAVWAATS